MSDKGSVSSSIGLERTISRSGESMNKEQEEMKEVVVYTAESGAIAEMLVEKLENLDIPARAGSESVSAGVFGVPGGG